MSDLKCSEDRDRPGPRGLKNKDARVNRPHTISTNFARSGIYRPILTQGFGPNANFLAMTRPVILEHKVNIQDRSWPLTRAKTTRTRPNRACDAACVPVSQWHDRHAPGRRNLRPFTLVSVRDHEAPFQRDLMSRLAGAVPKPMRSYRWGAVTHQTIMRSLWKSTSCPRTATQATRANNRFVWRWTPPSKRHGGCRRAIRDVWCWLRRSWRWWACARHDDARQPSANWSGYLLRVAIWAFRFGSPPAARAGGNRPHGADGRTVRSRPTSWPRRG